MDLIAIDIGNSTISMGIFAQQELQRTEQLAVSDVDPPKLANILVGFRELCGPQPLGARTVPVAVSYTHLRAHET